MSQEEDFEEFPWEGTPDQERVGDNLWTEVRLNSTTKDGHPRTNLHSHEGELKELRDEIIESLDKHDREISGYLFDEEEHREPEHEDAPDLSIIDRSLSHKIVSLFAISVGVMEEQCKKILQQTVVSTDTRGTEISEDLLENGFKDNLDLVQQLPVADDYELSDQDDVRKTRNRMVHNPKNRLYVDDLDILKGRLKKAVRAPEELHELNRELSNIENEL